MLLCSRQSGKSTTTAALACHSAIFDPGLILLVAPAQRQSDASVLIRELQEFLVKYTDAGNTTFNAREGELDDLVLALAIAVFGLSESTCATSASVREFTHQTFFAR